jgi:dipeptidyl aminopeptidase/acylaminoacyl peptidase
MSLQEKRLYDFGCYRLDARKRVLLSDGQVVPLAPKAVDLLVALVENSNRVLSKDELMKLVWPDSYVVTSGLSGFGNYGLGVTADGTTLVAESWESAAQLWTVGVDGNAGGAARVTTGNADGRHGLAGLPDGRIVYVAREGGQSDIWTIKADGAEATPLTADAFNDWQIAATPDGRQLIFISDRGGGSHIFRAEADGSRPEQLTFGEAQMDALDCSPDGQWVVYAASQNEKTTFGKFRSPAGLQYN